MYIKSKEWLFRSLYIILAIFIFSKSYAVEPELISSFQGKITAVDVYDSLKIACGVLRTDQGESNAVSKLMISSDAGINWLVVAIDSCHFTDTINNNCIIIKEILFTDDGHLIVRGHDKDYSKYLYKVVSINGDVIYNHPTSQDVPVYEIKKSTGSLYGIKWSDTSDTYHIRYDVLYKSKDQGKTWDYSGFLKPDSISFYSYKYFDSDSWITCNYRDYAEINRTTICHSFDKGKSWNSYSFDSLFFENGRVEFFNERTGIGVGTKHPREFTDHGRQKDPLFDRSTMIYKTDNAGADWHRVAEFPGFINNTCAISYSSTCGVFVLNDDNLIFSYDEGEHWGRSSIDAADKRFDYLKVTDQNCLYLAAFDSGRLYLLKNIRNYNSIHEPLNLINSISATPLPFNDEITIGYSVAYPENINVSIFNLQGESIYSHDYLAVAGSNSIKICSRELTSGIYIVAIKSGKSITSKVIIRN